MARETTGSRMIGLKRFRAAMRKVPSVSPVRRRRACGCGDGDRLKRALTVARKCRFSEASNPCDGDLFPVAPGGVAGSCARAGMAAGGDRFGRRDWAGVLGRIEAE